MFTCGYTFANEKFDCTVLLAVQVRLSFYIVVCCTENVHELLTVAPSIIITSVVCCTTLLELLTFSQCVGQKMFSSYFSVPPNNVRLPPEFPPPIFLLRKCFVWWLVPPLRSFLCGGFTDLLDQIIIISFIMLSPCDEG